MRKTRLIIVIFFIAFLGLFTTGNTNAGINQWTTHGPEVGVIGAIAINPDSPSIIYVQQHRELKYISKCIESLLAYRVILNYLQKGGKEVKRIKQIFITVVIVLPLFSAIAYSAWTANKRLTWNAGYSEHPAIAVDGPNIYVVWYDDTPGNAEIFLKKSDDGGSTWVTKRLGIHFNIKVSKNHQYEV